MTVVQIIWLLLMQFCGLFIHPVIGQDDPPAITVDILYAAQISKSGYLELYKGSLVNLYITAKGSGLLYIWTQNDIVIKNSTEFRLTFTSNVNHTGVYRCIVQNSLGSVRSLPFILVIKELGNFPQSSNQTVNIQEGKYAVIPLPNISYIPVQGTQSIDWQKDDYKGIYYITLRNDFIALNVQSNSTGVALRAKLTHFTSVNTIDTYTNFFILNVSAFPASNLSLDFVLKPQNASVKQGDDAKLECVVIGPSFSNIQLSWSIVTGTVRNAISPNLNYSLDNGNKSLTIRNVSPANAGVYECQASLSVQSISERAFLSVLQSPSAAPVPSVLRKDFQDPFWINCSVQGFPLPQVIWYFNARRIEDLNNTRVQILPNNTLVIPSVDLPDSGIYQCVAVNTAGEFSTYTYLSVNSAPPSILEAPTNTTLVEFEDLTFTCKVIGGPVPDVYWTKDNVNLTIGGNVRVTVSQLLIGRVQISDSGYYRCIAVNSKGSVSAGAALTVIIKTQINKPPQNMSKILTTDALLDCGVRKDPSLAPLWTWYFYKSPEYIKQNVTVDGRRQIFSNGSLLITNLVGSDTGRYECVVQSLGGNDNKSATLTVIDTPAAPAITSVVLNTQLLNSVIINWDLRYDGDTAIIKFTIQKLESSTGTGNGESWSTIYNNVNSTLRSFVVNGLTPSKYYRFRMTAVNVVGESPPSEAAPEQSLKMPAQPPGEPPRNLYCKTGQEQEIIVQWEAPPEASLNGELLGFIIYYKVEAFSDETEKLQNISSKDTRQSSLQQLIYYRKYRIRIAAYNEKGPGVNSSDFFVITLQGKPTAPPQNVVLIPLSSTVIQIQWQPPPTIQLNGVNKGYDIEIKQGGVMYRIEFFKFNELNPTGNQTYNITNLLKYTMFDIQINCRTEAGAGPQSPTQSIRTREDLPGQVSNLKIDNIRDKSLRINWQPPLEINGILTGYIIKYKIKTSLEPFTSIDRSPEIVSHTLNDLLYDTTYVISVQAKTSEGAGAPVQTEIVSGVPPELPGPPTRLAVTNIEARSVLLQFFPGFDGHTLITLWIVQAKIENSLDWVNIYNLSDAGANQIEVKNLLPYTRYVLRLIAQNIVDKSEPSEPCNQFQTKQAAPGMPPQDVTPRAISSTAIRVRWRQIPRTEWNGDFLGYKLKYRRWSKDVNVNTTSPADLLLLQQPNWTLVELNNGSSIQEYIISGLEEWMDYQIEMTSYNAVGNSTASPIVSEKTDEDVPKISPGNLLSLTMSSTSIKVSWSQLPVLEQNGNIKGYKVLYRIAKSMNAVADTVLIDGDKTLNVNLSQLKKYTDYEIQVLAFTRMGDGALSSKIFERTAEDVPGPPVIIYFPVVTDNSATIVWQPPEEPNGNIMKYKVSYKQKDEPDSMFDINAVEKPSNEFEKTVTGLNREMYYIFSVTAQTKNGWGETAKVDVFIFANRDRPDAPTRVKVDSSETLARSLTVTWTPGNDNYGPVRNFTIQLKKKGDVWTTVPQTIKPQLTSYTVTGLQPFTVYTFRVAATNDVGTSSFSLESNETRTRPDKPDGAPQNVKIVALTQTSIKITWDNPLSSTWNGDVMLANIVQYREESSSSLAFREESVPFNQPNAMLQGLIIGLRYDIQVLSVNNVGPGPPSTLQVFRVGDVAPSAAPLSVSISNKSSSSLEMSWQLPPSGTTNGQLIGYKVLYWLSINGLCETSSSSTQLSVTELKTLLTGLRPYTFYCGTVQAVNIAGEGPTSAPVVRRTSEDYPGAPEKLRFANITLTELTVLWSPPSVPNGEITFYTLEYYAIIDALKTDVSTIKLPGYVTQQDVTDLVTNQSYNFTLSANTSIGRGAVSRMSVIPGPQLGSPEPPTKPEVTYKSKFIYITWQKPNEGSSPIYAYKLYYKEDGQADKWTLLLDINNLASAQLSENDLKPNAGYYFSVRAMNSVGISQPSPASELYSTRSYTAMSKQASAPFHTQWWFLIIVALAGVVIILLIITLLCCVHKRRKKQTEMKRSTTSTTVMSTTPEPMDGGFPSMELRQSRRSVNRLNNNKTENSIYSRSPPRPSPASVLYAEAIPPMAAAASRPAISDSSSVLSDKPSNIGDSSDEETSISDDSSIDSIAKAPVPASPPPPAFSSQFSRSTSNNTSVGAGPSSSRHGNKHQKPNSKIQSPPNAYTYTDSEADSSHYAFSLTNGNIVVNNVARARTPLSGFSSFV